MGQPTSSGAGYFHIRLMRLDDHSHRRIASIYCRGRRGALRSLHETSLLRGGCRAAYEKDWSSSRPVAQQMAVALYFIDVLALRAGHEKEEDEADTVGCCTLKAPPCAPTLASTQFPSRLHPHSSVTSEEVLFTFECENISALCTASRSHAWQSAWQAVAVGMERLTMAIIVKLYSLWRRMK